MLIFTVLLQAFINELFETSEVDVSFVERFLAQLFKTPQNVNRYTPQTLMNAYH
jgi:hypothetical protein